MQTDNATKARLKSFVERIERLEDEKTNISSDITEVYKEAKSEGFDCKIMKKVIALRKLDSEDRFYQEEMIDNYLMNLGMQLENPQTDMFKETVKEEAKKIEEENDG